MQLTYPIIAHMGLSEQQKAAYIPPHLRGRAYRQDDNPANNGWAKPVPRQQQPQQQG